MNSEIFKKSNNLFIIHPPGTGGNHLANILSLCEGFDQRIQVTGSYVDAMTTYYNTKYLSWNANFHFCRFQNLQEKTLLAFKDTLHPSLINIFCAHAVEYYNAVKDKILKDIDNQCFILFTFPKQGSCAYSRMIHGPWWNYPNHKSEDYDVLNFCETNNIPHNSVMTIDTDLFMSDNGHEYLESILDKNNGFTMPKIVKEMHTLWYSAVSKSPVI